MRIRRRFPILAGAALVALAACQPVSDPWVTGARAKQLAPERTRTAEQQHELRARLERYGGAYQ